MRKYFHRDLVLKDYVAIFSFDKFRMIYYSSQKRFLGFIFFIVEGKISLFAFSDGSGIEYIEKSLVAAEV